MNKWLFIGFFLIIGCSASKHKGFLAKEYKTSSGWKIPYNAFYPKSYGETKEGTPLLVWLHGAGERGDDNISPLIHIVPYLASDITQSKFQFAIIAPQCPKDGYWAPVKRFEWTIENGGSVTPAMQGVISILEEILKDPKIDKSRVYVGGLSMGGFGTLDLLSRKPEWFAAGIPICGGADLDRVKYYKDVPLWIFHGAKDEVVSPDLSRNLVKTLNKIGVNPKYKEYPEGGHGIWNDAIREPDLLPWLFLQRKSNSN